MTTRRLFGLVAALMVSISVSVFWYLDALESGYQQASAAPLEATTTFDLVTSDVRPRRRHLRMPSATGELRMRQDYAPGAILGASSRVLTVRPVGAEKSDCWYRAEIKTAEG